MRQIAYVHSEKGDNYYQAIQWGLSEQAASHYRWTLLEVAVDVDVNEETGETKVLSFHYEGKTYYPLEEIK